MLKYLIVILANSSVSFCNYRSGNKLNKKKNLIPLPALKNAVVFALKHNLKVNFLYPDFRVGKKYESIIEDVENVKIVPFNLIDAYKDSIVVLKTGDVESFCLLKNKDANVILSIEFNEINSLFPVIKKLIPKSKRINLVIHNIENFKEDDYEKYLTQLDKISGLLLKSKSLNEIPELNFLTDRMLITEMNNCNAGLSHITVAPNGKVYTCPAFYHENPLNNHGDLNNNIFLKNKRLLELKYSPVCRVCDAYHCKRCVFLNKKFTSEINIPSHQQCIVSHTEREASRILLDKLKTKSNINSEFTSISKLDYNDPFVIAEKNKLSISEFKNIF